MRPRFRAMLLLLGCQAAASVMAADDARLSLLNNPFTRPEILKPKPPPPPAPRVILPPEQVELELTATMVSETAPMVVVNGELLALGEKIEGLKLIKVMEHKAVFTRGGRKFTVEIEMPQAAQR